MGNGYTGIDVSIEMDTISLLLYIFENCYLKIFLKLKECSSCGLQFIPRQYTWMESGKKNKDEQLKK